MAQVSIDVESSDEIFQEYYFDKLWSLEGILKAEYLPEAILDPAYEIAPGRVVSRVYVQLDGVSIHDDSTWPRVFEFFKENMVLLEAFFLEYADYIKD